MSQMLAEISRIVSEDISNRVTQYDVLYEAITNAIHANATDIICKFESFDYPIKESNIRRKVDTISIMDNGDGFNTENWNSFCKYRSDYKKLLGGKGVGRFVFLKVYENVIFICKLKKEKLEKTFKFNIDFDTKNIKKDPINKTIKIEKNTTEVFFSKLTSQYLDIVKHLDRRIELNLDEIREKVLLHLIPILFFYKKKQIDIKIDFFDNLDSKPVKLSHEDIPDFFEQNFEIIDKQEQLHKFTLSYKIEKNDGKLHAYYCANNRTVCEFSDKDFNFTLPNGYSGFILLESEYFNKHANNDRNDFDIFPKKVDLFSSISWDMINSKLKSIISGIVNKGIPETKKINTEKIKKIHDGDHI